MLLTFTRSSKFTGPDIRYMKYYHKTNYSPLCFLVMMIMFTTTYDTWVNVLNVSKNLNTYARHVQMSLFSDGEGSFNFHCILVIKTGGILVFFCLLQEIMKMPFFGKD